MELLDRRNYRIEGIELYPASRSVVARGEIQPVRPKTFDVLIHLIENRDRLVSKEELIEAAWRGLSVGDDSLVQCIAEIRRILGDDARAPHLIRTVSRRGYQFIGPIEEISSIAAPCSPALEETTTLLVRVDEKANGVFWKSRTAAWSAVAIAILIVAGTIVWARSWTGLNTTLPLIDGRSSIMVLPFENQSNSGELGWLREGLSDMLIANLSRSPKLNVLSRQQLALLLAQSGHSGVLNLNQAIEIARHMRASEMIWGTFVHIGDQVRVAAQIVRVSDGQTVAAENITAGHPAQILAQMDTLALELASDLGAPVAGRARGSGLTELMTNNLEAYRDYSLGLEMANGLHETEAIGLFQQALTLDPEFVMAQARIGYVLALTAGRAREGRPYLEKAFARSKDLSQSDRLHIAAWYAVARLDYPNAIRRYRELLAADPTETETYERLGRLLRGEERREEAIETLKQGLTWDPNATDILNILGAIYSQLGRHEEAIVAEQKYVALAPDEPNAHDSLALAYHWAGRHGEAEREYLRAIQLRPNFGVALRHLGTLYLHTGRYRAAVHQMELAAQRQQSESDLGNAHYFMGVVRTQLGEWYRAAEEGRMIASFPYVNALVAAPEG